MPAGFSGTEFYIVAKVDSANAVSESDETNNFGSILQSGPGLTFDILDINTFPLNLHSFPGATKRIYLDFTGHRTQDPEWEQGIAFRLPAYNFEGTSASFTSEELDRIRAIWERVSEDFLPFAVDMTTEDPGDAALRNIGGTDAQWGTRVVIGGSSAAFPLLRSVENGLGSIGSFTGSRDTPCFVFTENFGAGEQVTA